MKLKRFFVVLASMFLIMSVFAGNKDLEKDITMVSYEQSWNDYDGTLALKNNTGEEISNIIFQITYLDMSGNALDYEVFTKEVSIASGMTKKINIPAYEHSREYHYYKSKGAYGGSPSFKIKFQLKDYNVELQENDKDNYGKYDYIDSSSNNNEGLYMIIAIAIILFIIGLTVGLYVLVAIMAKKQNRNIVLWILLSILTTPLLMAIILLCIGKDKHNDIINE